MIIGFEIMQMVDCSTDYRFRPMLGEIIWKGTWIVCIHSRVDLKPQNPYSFSLQTVGSSFVLAELQAHGHERPVTTFNIWHFAYKYYVVTVGESCLWFWSF